MNPLVYQLHAQLTPLQRDSLKQGGINIIVACARNRTIGREGRLPWDLPEDWQYFLDHTAGQVCLFGRHSYQEMLTLGEATPHRTCLVITSQPQRFPDAWCASSLRAALTMGEQLAHGRPIWICGGHRLYAEALPLADRLYLTHIDADIEGDTTFPSWEEHFPAPAARLEGPPHESNLPHEYRLYLRSQA